MAADSDIVKIAGALGTVFARGVAFLINAYWRARKELASLKRTESRVGRDISQDKTDENSLKLLLASAEQWREQYRQTVSRETRLRRQLAVTEAKMRRFAEQAARDRDEDRYKIEQLVRRVDALERENADLRQSIGARRAEDAR